VFKNLQVAEVFGEKISGTIKAIERPEFNKMLHYIEEYDIHHVLVTELSRLGRKMRDTINIIQDFNERKICVHIFQDSLSTLDKNFKENKFTGLIINILVGFADIERETFAERSKSGLRFNVKNQGSGTGIIKPFGYKKVGQKLMVDDEEAEIVKLIFQKYLQGYGSQQIANLLNDNGIKTKYNKIFKEDRIIKTRSGRYKKASSYIWRDATIINILKNSIYKGERNHKGEVFEIDAIIDADTFANAELLRKEKYNKKDNIRQNQNIFKDKIKCPVCGSGYFIHRRSNGRDNAYKCLSKRLKDVECTNNSIGIDKLNNSIYSVLKESFKFQTGIDKKLSSKSVAIKEKMTFLEAEINQVVNEVANFKTRQKNLLTSYLDKEIDKIIFTELNNEIMVEIKNRENKIKEKSKELNTNKSILETVSLKKNQNLENVDIFKKYVKDYITFIKIYDVTELVSSGDLGSLFKVKNDVVSLVEVQSDLIDSYITFLVSRYSDLLIKLDLVDTEDLDRKLPYISDYHSLKVGNIIKI